MFLQSDQLPLLIYNIEDIKIIIYGYYGNNIILGEKFQYSSFYISGFETFHCTKSMKYNKYLWV